MDKKEVWTKALILIAFAALALSLVYAEGLNDANQSIFTNFTNITSQDVSNESLNLTIPDETNLTILNESSISNMIEQTEETPENNTQLNETKKFKLLGEIKDAKGNNLNADIRFINKKTGKIDEFKQNKKGRLGVQAESELDEGKYSVVISLEETPVNKITIEEVEMQSDVSSLIDVDDAPETDGFVEVYAINPLINFTSAIVEVTAKGNALYKCKEWNFEEQRCDGEWVFLQSIIPGKKYTFTINVDDPGFAETLQPGATTGKDTYIASGAPNSNYGDAIGMDVLSDTRRILIEFNLSSIPSNARITAANLKLYTTAKSAGDPVTDIYRLNRSWAESGVTWNKYDGTNSWTTAGGDFDSVKWATTTIAAVGWSSWNITNLIQNWVNGSYSNYGMLVKSDTTGSGTANIASSDHSDSAKWPILELNYTTPLNITFVSPTPNNTTTINITSAFINVSLTNGNASSAKLEWINGGSTNYTMSNSSGSNWYYNVSGLGNAAYTYRVYANDSFDGTVYVSETRTVTVNADVLCTTLNISNSIYTLTGNASSLGTCFKIGANNVTLDCQGRIVNYSISSKGYGVNNTGYNFTTVKNCNFVEGSASGDDNYGIYYYNSYNGTIYNNTINTYKTDTYGAYLYNSNYQNISNNNITARGNSAYAIYLRGTSNSTVNANYLYANSGSSGQYALYLYNAANNNTISYNNVNATSASACIRLFSSANYNKIIYNNVTTGAGNAIDISGAGYENISYNKIIHMSGASWGIYLNTAVNTTVFYNDLNITGSSSVGIYLLSGGNYNDIEFNNISSSGNVAMGMQVRSNSNSNYFNSNNISTNGSDNVGIRFRAGSTGNVLNNLNILTFGTGDSYPIDIYDSSNNFSIYDSKVNASSGVADFIIRASPIGIWNFVNVTKSNNNPINVSWAAGVNGTLNMRWYLDANVTSQNGTALDGANVSVYYGNDTYINSNLTDSNGKARFTLLGFMQNSSSGIYYEAPYTADVSKEGYGISSNSSINMSNNVLLRLTLDQIPPLITLNLPDNSTQINNTQTVNFNFTATSHYSTTLSCSIYLGGLLNQTNASTQNNTLTNFQISGISYESHSWFVNCSDGSLNNVSETRYFVIGDTIAPNGTAINPANATITNITSQNFTINLSDSNGLRNVTLNIYNETGLYNRTTIDLGGVTQTTIGIVVGLVNGVYNWFWEIFDLAGNFFTTQTAEGNRTITIDTINPQISISSPLNANYTNATILVNITSTGDYTWFDNGTGIEVYTTPVYRTFGEGSTTLTAYTNDTAGNANSTSVMFFVDTIKPSTITNLANVSKGASWIYWNWTNPADSDFSQAIVYVNGSNLANTSNNYYNATGLNPHTSYTITVHAKDTRGNVNNTDVNLTASTANTPPTAVNVTINPSNPSSSDDLTCNYSYSDADSDSESGTSFAWYKNDALQAGIVTQILDDSYTLFGENWTCQVTPSDGSDNGTAVNSSTKTIQNGAPVAVNLTLTSSDSQNRTNGTLMANWAFSDPDLGDTYQGNETKWYKNNAEQDALANLSQVDSSYIAKGESWKVSVRVYDGSQWGVWTNSSALIIQNTLPTAPVVDVLPNIPQDNNDLAASITSASLDADNDTITYSYQWYKNNVSQPGQTSSTLSNLLTSAGENWTCRVTPNDGTGNGPIGEDSVMIADSTPPAGITNLANQSRDTTWIYWNWTNPTDADFSQAIVYVNGSNLANTSSNYYNATGLNPNTNYTIAINTKDNTGNINNTNVSSTSSTLEWPDTSAPTILSTTPTNGTSLSAGTTSYVIQLTTDETAICRYNTTNEEWDNMTQLEYTNSTIHNITATGLSNANTYNYYFLCEDDESVPNRMNSSYNLQFSVSSSGGGGGGGGGGGRTKPPVVVVEENETDFLSNIPTFNIKCIESWSCSDWYGCVNGMQARQCIDANNCGTTIEKPEERRPCEAGNETGPGIPAVTGQAIKVMPYKGPNPYRLVPTILLLVIFIVLAAAKKSQMSARKHKAVSALHYALMGIILLLFASATIEKLPIGAFLAGKTSESPINAITLVMISVAFVLAAVSSIIIIIEKKKLSQFGEGKIKKHAQIPKNQSKIDMIHNLKKIYKL